MRLITTKFLLVLLVLLLSCSMAYGQATGAATTIRFGATDPSTCTPNGTNIFFNTTTGTLKTCTSTNTWTSLSTGSQVFSGGLSGTFTYDPPSLTNGQSDVTTYTLGGATVGDTIVVSFSQALPAGMWFAIPQVTAPNTVKVTLINESGSTQDVASGSLKLITAITNIGTVGAVAGGFGTDVSSSSGVPLFSTGTPTFVSTTGTGNFVRTSSPTIVTPTIASFANAPHDHSNSAGGGTLSGSVIASGTIALARGGTGASLSDPNANILLGWDDTDNAINFFTLGNFLSYDHSTHTLSATSPYDLATQVTGKPDASAVVLRFIATRAFTLPVTGSVCSAGTAATAQTDFDVQVNGVSKGTLRFAASGTTCSIVSPTSASVAIGDVVKIIAPGSQDSTLADLAFTLKGSNP